MTSTCNPRPPTPALSVAQPALRSGKPRKPRGHVLGQNHLHTDLGLLAWIRKCLSPLRQQTALEGKQQKLIGQLFASGVEWTSSPQLDCLPDSVAVAPISLISMVPLLWRPGYHTETFVNLSATELDKLSPCFQCDFVILSILCPTQP